MLPAMIQHHPHVWIRVRSGANLFVVLLIGLHPTQELEPPGNPGRFTYYRWRSKYGGLMPSEMKRLKQLEEENGRLRKLVADLSLDKEMLQDVTRRKL